MVRNDQPNDGIKMKRSGKSCLDYTTLKLERDQKGQDVKKCSGFELTVAKR